MEMSAVLTEMLKPIPSGMHTDGRNRRAIAALNQGWTSTASLAHQLKCSSTEAANCCYQLRKLGLITSRRMPGNKKMYEHRRLRAGESPQNQNELYRQDRANKKAEPFHVEQSPINIEAFKTAFDVPVGWNGTDYVMPTVAMSGVNIDAIYSKRKPDKFAVMAERLRAAAKALEEYGKHMAEVKRLQGEGM